MGRTLEQILAQEDPQMVADAQKLAAEMLLDIGKTERVMLKEKAIRESRRQPDHATTH